MSNKKKSTSYKIYQILIAIIAVSMIVSLIVMAVSSY